MDVKLKTVFDGVVDQDINANSLNLCRMSKESEPCLSNRNFSKKFR